MIEEAQIKSRIFLDKCAAADDPPNFEHTAFKLFLAIEQGGAKLNSISSPSEREALVSKHLAFIFDRCERTK